MNRRITIFLCSLLCCIMGCKAETAEALIVSMKDNKKVEFYMPENPRVKFGDSGIVISSKNFTGTYSYDVVRSLYFAKVDGPTSIKKVGKNTLQIIYDGQSTCVIKGLEKNDIVFVYDISGRKVECANRVSTGSVSVSLQDCPKGVYLINVEGKHSFKVARK